MKNVLWFDEIGMTDLPAVGGKNASLGVVSAIAGVRVLQVACTGEGVAQASSSLPMPCVAITFTPGASSTFPLASRGLGAGSPI